MTPRFEYIIIEGSHDTGWEPIAPRTSNVYAVTLALAKLTPERQARVKVVGYDLADVDEYGNTDHYSEMTNADWVEWMAARDVDAAQEVPRQIDL